MIYHYRLINKKCLIKIKSKKASYKYVNSKLHAATYIAPYCDNNANLNYDDKIRASLLNKFFGSVFANDNDNIPVFHSRSNSSIYPNNIIFCPENICLIIKLKSNAVTGYDRLPTNFSINCTSHYPYL